MSDTKNGAQRLSQHLRSVTGSHPELTFDLGYPSLGLLDALLGRAGYLRPERRPIHDISCYLAECTARAWSRFDKNIQVSTCCNTGSVIVTATGGTSLGNGVSHLDVSAVVESLGSAWGVTPFFERASRRIERGHNLASLMGLGLLAALSPRVEGAWKGRRVYHVAPHLLAAQTLISDDCARHYRRLHPLEPIGSEADLFSELLLPPAGFDEPSPGLRAVSALLDYLKAREAPLTGGNSSVRDIAYRLALFPDEHISSTGFVVAAALSSGAPSGTLAMLVDAKRERLAELRPAFVLAREITGQASDWLNDLKSPESIALCEREKALGFLPLLSCSSNLLRNPELAAIFRAAAFNSADLGLKAVDDLRLRGSVHGELNLQAARFAEALGDYDRANRYLEQAGDGQRASLLRGRILIALERHDEAAVWLEQALPLGLEAATLLAQALAHLEQQERAVAVLRDACSDETYAITAKLLLLSLDPGSEASRELARELYRYASFDLRIFEHLLATAESHAS